jgi:hypothetical protein
MLTFSIEAQGYSNTKYLDDVGKVPDDSQIAHTGMLKSVLGRNARERCQDCATPFLGQPQKVPWIPRYANYCVHHP